MIGFLNVAKPAGLTSHDVVARIRRLVGRKVKTGHAGTLDPAATGVLPIALGQANRLIPYLSESHKGYRAGVCLGITTTTEDAEGEVVQQKPVAPLDEALVEQVLQSFRGDIMQVPPMYSALHHQGKRLYELAREGKTVAREPRPVTIAQLTLLHLTQESPHMTLDVVCSKGTYIRSLARDIGEALGCGAHLLWLERTSVGPFTLDTAIPLETLMDQPDTLTNHLLPPEIAVLDWYQVTLDDTQSKLVRNGQQIPLAIPENHHVVRAHQPDGSLLALLRRKGEVWQPERVFGT